MNEHQHTTREEESVTFIGKHAEKYLTTFQKFHVNGGDHFSVTWHWPAFFFPFFWMVYRKLYLWAILSFIVGVTIRLLPLEFFQCLNMVGLDDIGTCLRLFPFGFLSSTVGFLLPMVGFGLTANYIYYKHMKKKLSALHQVQALSDTQRAAIIVHTGGVNNIAATVVVSSIAFGLAALGKSYTLTSYGKDKKAGDKGYTGYEEDIIIADGILIAPDRIR